MFCNVGPNTLNEKSFIDICHKCGFEPRLYYEANEKRFIGRKYTVALDTVISPTGNSEDNLCVVFSIDINKRNLRPARFECVVYNKIKIMNCNGCCYLTTQLNGSTVIDPAVLEDQLLSLSKEVKLFNITEKLRRIRSICKESVCE